MQIARAIFHKNLSVMKQILDLGEFKLGKNSEDFKYYKKQIMDAVYKGLLGLFQVFVEEKLIEKCSCGAKLRQGYNDCKDCGGSGYRNATK